MKVEKMVEKFQCPGCVVGSNTRCGRYKDGGDDQDGHFCASHVVGTTLNFSIHIALGLPKGFNRSGPDENFAGSRNVMRIRLWPKGVRRTPADTFNRDVWAMVEDGFLFVRSYSPRIDVGTVHVVEGGTLKDASGALDVGGVEMD